jgi:hypothetical protein
LRHPIAEDAVVTFEHLEELIPDTVPVSVTAGE